MFDISITFFLVLRSNSKLAQANDLKQVKSSQ